MGLAGENVTLLTSTLPATWDVAAVFVGDATFRATGCLAYSFGVYPFLFKVAADYGLNYYWTNEFCTLIASSFLGDAYFGASYVIVIY